MNWTRRRLVAGLGATPLLGSCDYLSGWTLTYRLSMRIKIGAETFEGSSVLRSKYTRHIKFDTSDDFDVRSWGEAIVLKCGDKGTWFGLLNGIINVGAHSSSAGFTPSHERGLLGEMPNFSLDDFQSGKMFWQFQTIKGGYPLEELSWPILVSFANMHDVKTACLVRARNTPYEIPEGWPAEEHPDVTIDEARVEPWIGFVNGRISRFLPWVDGLNRDGVFEQSMEHPFWQNLLRTNFKLRGN